MSAETPERTEESPTGPEAAPIYVAAFDLSLEVMRRTGAFPRNQRFVLARRMQEAVLDLLDAITLALYQPEVRSERLAAADAALARLRVATRLARELKLLAITGALDLGDRMAEVGRQLGGWRRKGRI